VLQHSFNNATDGLNGRADDRSLLFKQEMEGAAAFELHKCSACGSTTFFNTILVREGEEESRDSIQRRNITKLSITDDSNCQC
jgi:hypothetical protein